MVFLGRVEGAGFEDLGDDRDVEAATLVEGVARGFGQLSLLIVVVEDGRPVLRAAVEALAEFSAAEFPSR